MRRINFLTPDHLPLLIMTACLILGMAFPTLGLWLGGTWTAFLAAALSWTWWTNRQSLDTSMVKAGLMVVSVVLAGTTGLTTIRWWLPWLGNLLQVQS